MTIADPTPVTAHPGRNPKPEAKPMLSSRGGGGCDHHDAARVNAADPER